MTGDLVQRVGECVRERVAAEVVSDAQAAATEDRAERSRRLKAATVYSELG